METATPEDDLESQAQAIPQRGGGLDVPVGDIPLPPPELRAELDNSGGADKAPAEADPEVATLDFFGDDLPYRDFPLKYSFRWEGKPVTAIRVSQLSVAEVGRIVAEARKDGRQPELFDFYAAMCGLPAKVIRALPALDGDMITGAAWDFLPQWVQPGPA